MPKDEDRELFRTLPPRLRLPLSRCTRGELPNNVALTHLFMAARDAAEAKTALVDALNEARQCDAAAAERLSRSLDLWEHTPEAFATVSEVLRAVGRHGLDMAAEDAAAHWAAAFDRAAGISPEASVALYSLGRPDLLARITAEIVEWMRASELLWPGCVALDIGCGNGRMLHALAPETQLVVGIDVSSAMLSAARARCVDCDNIRLVRGTGYDLSTFADERFDLVYAVDVFPYLVRSGLAHCHLREAARVLKPGGRLLIFNYSYRGDADADRDEISVLASCSDLAVVKAGSREFALWDALPFLMKRVR